MILELGQTKDQRKQTGKTNKTKQKNGLMGVGSRDAYAKRKQRKQGQGKYFTSILWLGSRRGCLLGPTLPQSALTQLGIWHFFIDNYTL